MKLRNIIIFLVAVLIGISATWLANSWIIGRLTVDASPDSNAKPVVVATLEIAFGQQIEEIHVKTVLWPKELIPSGAIQNLGDALGKIANQTIVPGEPILESRVVAHLSGSTLSAMINPEMRAVTVRVNDVLGVAGFLMPGNHVDILSSRMVNRRAVTETILQNIKVLAVDQTSSPDKDKPTVVRAVTLEITPDDAEILVKATQEGTVQLALRNPLDDVTIVKKVEEKQEPKPAKTVSRPRPAPKAPTRAPITVIRGTNVTISNANL